MAETLGHRCKTVVARHLTCEMPGTERLRFVLNVQRDKELKYVDRPTRRWLRYLDIRTCSSCPNSVLVGFLSLDASRAASGCCGSYVAYRLTSLLGICLGLERKNSHTLNAHTSAFNRTIAFQYRKPGLGGNTVLRKGTPVEMQCSPERVSTSLVFGPTISYGNFHNINISTSLTAIQSLCPALAVIYGKFENKCHAAAPMKCGRILCPQHGLDRYV